MTQFDMTWHASAPRGHTVELRSKKLAPKARGACARVDSLPSVGDVVTSPTQPDRRKSQFGRHWKQLGSKSFVVLIHILHILEFLPPRRSAAVHQGGYVHGRVESSVRMKQLSSPRGGERLPAAGPAAGE